MEVNYFTILWWFLPYTDMNQPWVYMCPPSQIPSHLPSNPIAQGRPSALALSTLSRALNLVIYFTLGNIHASMLFSQIIPLLPSLTESKSLFFTSVSLLLSLI